MKNNLSKRTKLSVMAALMAIAASQTGAVVGICALVTPAGVPLILTGAGIVTVGGIVAAGGLLAPQPDPDADGAMIAGVILMTFGFFLDEQNPGSVAALTEVPNTAEQQQAMGVSATDIEAYNEHLTDQIPTAYAELKKQAAAELKNWTDKNPTMDTKDLKVHGPSTMPSTQLAAVATHLGLSTSDAKILLAKTFGTKF
jgi:hypothetical protein